MSNPSFSNIDRWLFELVEGNLTPEQVQQLEAFLLQHPELDVDKDVWELAKVEPTEVVYPNQDKFIRRKPVGLYMMAGFVSMAIFVAIGINEFIGSGTDQGQLLAQDSEQSNLQSEFKKNGVVYSGKYNTSGKTNGSNIEQSLDNSSEYASILNDVDLVQFRSALSGLQNELNQYNALTNIGYDEIDPTLTNTEEDLHHVNKNGEIETLPAEEIEVSVSREWKSASFGSGQRYAKSSVNESFSSKFSRTMRLIGRMMDNPVALKNLKDPNFSVPGLSSLDINNGLTGTLPATRIQTMSRLQWPGKENEMLSNQLSIDGYAYGIRGGIGVQFNNQYYGNGQIMNSNVALTYSPKISVSRNILIEPSMRFKMGNKSINEDKITGSGLAEMERDNVHEFYPTGVNPIGKQLWYRDLGLGMMVNTKWFFAGIQTDNLFRHYDNIYSGDQSSNRRQGTHLILTAGTDYESKREIIGLSPYIVYQQQENLKELWMGTNARISWFTFGAAVSDKMDAVASLGLRFDRFAISYSADYINSSMWNQRLLSHQVTLKYIQFNPNKRQKFINL